MQGCMHGFQSALWCHRSGSRHLSALPALGGLDLVKGTLANSTALPATSEARKDVFNC